MREKRQDQTGECCGSPAESFPFYPESCRKTFMNLKQRNNVFVSVFQKDNLAAAWLGKDIRQQGGDQIRSC